MCTNKYRKLHCAFYTKSLQNKANIKCPQIICKGCVLISIGKCMHHMLLAKTNLKNSHVSHVRTVASCSTLANKSSYLQYW